MNAKYLLVMSLAVGIVGSCRNTSSDSQPAASATAPAALTDEALDQAAIPVKEDFEEQARQTITEENFEDRISQLEKEIREDR